MALEAVIWPRDDLGGRPQVASNGLKWPQMSSNVLKCPQMTSILLWCPWRKVWAKTVKTVIWPWKPLYGLENRYMALKTVIWPWKPLKPLYGLKNRYIEMFNGFKVVIWPWRSLYGLGTASEVGLRWPQVSSNDLNIARCPWRKVWAKSIIWPLRSLYGLGGQYMALGRPQRLASSGLRWPQLSSNDLNCPQMTST